MAKGSGSRRGGPGPAVRQRRQEWALLGSALSPDALVELHPVPPLGGVAALLAADAADLAEEFFTMALLGGHTTLASSFGSGHLGSLGLGHPTPSSCGQNEQDGAPGVHGRCYPALDPSKRTGASRPWVSPSRPSSGAMARVCS